MSVVVEWAAIVIPVLTMGVGGLLWMERRLTRIDTLLSNHLAHHDAHDKLSTLIMERLLPNAMARFSELQGTPGSDGTGRG